MFNKREKFDKDGYKWFYRWNLLWYMVEGLEPLNGLNVYPSNDPSSAGFVFQAFHWRITVRWGKKEKKMFWGLERVK